MPPVDLRTAQHDGHVPHTPEHTLSTAPKSPAPTSTALTSTALTSTAPARRALVALATTAALMPAALLPAALLPAAPASARTPTPAPPTSSPTPAPVAPQLLVDETVIDVGDTHRLTVTGGAGAAVRLLGNGRPIRTATMPGSGQVTWELQPGGRTLFVAEVGGQRTPSVTVAVRRTVSIGIRQPTRAIYVLSGAIDRPEPGVQVTLARLDGETNRVTGVASTRTTADGRYEISTSLPVGLAGYYALTSATPQLDAGRSRLYGLLVNTRPGTPAPPPTAQRLSLDVRRTGDSYLFQGVLSPRRRGVPVRLVQTVDGRLSDLAAGITEADGSYRISIVPAPGTYQLTALTAGARSRSYGLVVPAAPVR